MKKWTQSITYKTALGLSFSLILVNQLAAQAGTASDKTAWLTQTLGQSKQGKNNHALVELKALPAQQDNRQGPKSIIVGCSNDSSHFIKLRPFMANRKLPSRQDLELALVEQKAKLADEASARLNGQVSAFAVGNENNNQDRPQQSTWGNVQDTVSRPISRNVTRRNYLKQQATGNNQSNFSFMKQAEQRLLSSVTPRVNELPVSTGAMQTTSTTSLSSAGPPMPAPVVPPVYAPLMEAYQPSIINTTSSFPTNSNSQPASFNNERTMSGFGSAGPPPFPLNLVPEATLKQLIRSLAGGRTSHAGSAPRAAFGSWRGNSSNLAYGGFQSHLSPRYQSMGSRACTYHISALPAVTASPIHSRSHAEKNQNASNAKDTAARNRMLLESQVRVASYPAYATQSLRAWNFAQ